MQGDQEYHRDQYLSLAGPMVVKGDPLIDFPLKTRILMCLCPDCTGFPEIIKPEDNFLTGRVDRATIGVYIGVRNAIDSAEG